MCNLMEFQDELNPHFHQSTFLLNKLEMLTYIYNGCNNYSLSQKLLCYDSVNLVI